jgi:murein DD-endopeptidase MepM/ murein hydrolase activator NlpD
VPAARGRKKPYETRAKVSAAVFKAVEKILRADNDVTKDAEALLRKLWGSGGGNRSGPAVTLIHHYKEPGTGVEAWVEVDYRHLSAVEPLTRGADIASGTAIGKVGSSGNAVSPHIHQAIRVYTKDPRLDKDAHVKAYLVPLDFFPFVLPGRARPTAGGTSADDPL